MEAQIAGPNISERGNTIVVVPNPLRSLFGSLIDLGSSKLRETVCDPHSILATIRSAVFRLRVPLVHIFNQRRQHFGRNRQLGGLPGHHHSHLRDRQRPFVPPVADRLKNSVVPRGNQTETPVQHLFHTAFVGVRASNMTTGMIR